MRCLARIAAAALVRESFGEAVPVVMFTMIKAVRHSDLVRFVEYHILLGVDHVVLFDNDCDQVRSNTTEAILRSYVAARLVTLRTEHRCSLVATMVFRHGFTGGSAVARQLSGMKGVPRGSLVLGLDDDEYLVLRNTKQTLRASADSNLTPAPPVARPAQSLAARRTGPTWRLRCSGSACVH